MADEPRNQKSISESYGGNLGYFLRPHYLRRLKLLAFLLAILGTVLVFLNYQDRQSQSAFSPAAISENHAQLTNKCSACHDMPENAIRGILSRPASLTTVRAMDSACLKCHATKGLHAPQTAALAGGSQESGTVHASACASCHREHNGGQRMAAVSVQRCVDCHNDTNKLRQAIAHSPSVPAREVSVSEARAGSARFFVPPPRKASALPAFASLANGHPVFGYERPGTTDSAAIKFNHERHSRQDIPPINDKKLDCAFCHQPESDGKFYRPITFEANCQPCHTLQIQQNLPNLRIPHGDPEKVRFFLASLDASIEQSLRAQGITNSVELAAGVQQEQQNLVARGIRNLGDLERRVFFEGEPQDTPTDAQLVRSGSRKFLTECSKCHTVTPGEPGTVPHVEPAKLPDRWLQKGAFTHLPHQRMACLDCHGAATNSRLTSDILLPSSQLCAKCHRAPDGAPWGCQNCHQFHAPMSPAAGERLGASLNGVSMHQAAADSRP